ncbi:peptidase [Cyanobium sp. HWJ4-Hawea]|uniref:peptidase n=1 Tax=Cyanobium sp. HWJ4-Hawea TaxID=2823713 RepID=UPI0020CFBF36|nr:peptidase [Cyanobium sp. HWJ4-Hawea]MCP9808783.1 peptidase [Cyanobium sp. HWJ4-Hawea]
MKAWATATALATCLGGMALANPAIPNQPATSPPASPISGPISGDYRDKLRSTPWGWPILPHWRVWVEPAVTTGPAALWDQRWLGAIEAALGHWQGVLSVGRVDDPAQAQILIFRRRPPIRNQRASHGRAELELVRRQTATGWQLEPKVSVAISPGQGPKAIEATALHELGHAFGLWGHSDNPADAMAVSPGAKPILQLSERDRVTLRWLYGQPGLKLEAGPVTPTPVTPAEALPGGSPKPPEPGAN